MDEAGFFMDGLQYRIIKRKRYIYKNETLILGTMRPLLSLGLLALILLNMGACSTETVGQSKSMAELKRDFVDLRFGMFLCYNIMSYGAEWGEASFPIESFNPQKLDCGQWADAALSANMTFGLLTAKHHEGFCLWDSEYTDYDVASTPYKKDIVKQYVDAFRSRDLKIGLYYSIWDSTHDIDKGQISQEKLDFIKGQIRELLGDYGKIDYFVLDGWFWRMGHHEVPFHEIRGLIRELQPECLITDHTHLAAPYHMDIPYYEGPYGAFPAKGNIMPSALGHCSVKGNGWFWSPESPGGMKENDGVPVVLEKLVACEARYCNFLLNCMPNREGLLDPIYLEMLEQVGALWSPDQNRSPLPGQGKQLAFSIPIKHVTVSSGDAALLMDGTKVPGGKHFTWVSDSHFPQIITIDLGNSQEVDVLTLVPDQRVKPPPEEPLSEGNVTACKIYTSSDNEEFFLVAEEKWEANALYRTVAFEPQQTRYLKIEILEANGKQAVLTAVEAGLSN